MYLIYSFLIIVLKALSEGLATAGHKDIAGVITVLWYASLVVSFWLWQTGTVHYPKREFKVLLNIILGFVLLYFAIFDWFWNLAAGQSLDYVGITKFWDLWINKFFESTHVHRSLYQVMKGLSGLIGISLLIKFSNKKYEL